MEKKNCIEKQERNVKKEKIWTSKKVNNRAFTLIELLAVIIILGVLMIIAIPSVTTYISNSRKSAYIDTAREVIIGARNVVNQGDLEMYDTNTTYYIPASYIKTEGALKSPYGDFTAAYVAVIYDGDGYKYYWISNDTSGQGISKLTSFDELDSDLIVSNLTDSKINSVIESTGIGERSEIKILNSNGMWDDVIGGATTKISEEGDIIVYPSGKTKDTVDIGQMVTIGTEEFYVVKHDGDNLVLLSRYNLKVGKIMDSNHSIIGEYTNIDVGYGIQSSETKAWVEGASSYNGVLDFSNTNYWNGNVGTGLKYPGKYCQNINETNCTYVYDSNSNLYQYVNNYKNYLEGLGVNVKEARLLKIEELYALLSVNEVICKGTSYWLGNAGSGVGGVWSIDSNGHYGYAPYSHELLATGVRPVIVI